ncbi:MAG: cytochrome b/b6 domain-containing protein [Candidatus Sericytochromatia bacterium]
MPKKLEKKHPLAIRWFHWLNFPLLMIMIYSGLLIYWANDVYEIKLGNFVLFKFFPIAFNEALGIPYRLAEGMAWHFSFMWLFAINGLLYVLYTLFSGEWRYLVPNRQSFGEAWQVLLYDLQLSKIHPPPRKFNGGQQIAYTGIILFGLGSLLTGLAIYRPVQLAWLCGLLGGYEMARLEHFLLTLGYLGFFVVHLIQVVRAGWNNFQAMVTGYELKQEPAPDLTHDAVPVATIQEAEHDGT